jgi:hypothetical protein
MFPQLITSPTPNLNSFARFPSGFDTIGRLVFQVLTYIILKVKLSTITPLLIRATHFLPTR